MTCDKTREQLEAANDKLVLGLYDGALGTYDADNDAFAFIIINDDDSAMDHTVITWNEEGEKWGMISIGYTLQSLG